MRQRNRDGVAQFEPRADAACETREAQNAPDCKPAHRDDQPGPEQLEFPLEPEAAELELARARRPVATSAWVPPGIAARDGRAVEGRVEPLFVQLQPATKSLARAAAPRTALLAFDDSWRLPDDDRALTRAPFEDGQRLEPIARLDARAANAVVALQRRERSISSASPGDARDASPACDSPPQGAGACSCASGP